ncbi:hypothetical protein [Methylobacterium sp. ID0610]|uniref:hypothetical protein n=1 Tax=Methylobacterium carpenticola TaxID=3344827 RepID=UPI0036957086
MTPTSPLARRVPQPIRVNPISTDETALPGHLLVLLSRLHRAEIAATEPAEPAGQPKA